MHFVYSSLCYPFLATIVIAALAVGIILSIGLVLVICLPFATGVERTRIVLALRGVGICLLIAAIAFIVFVLLFQVLPTCGGISAL